MRIRDIAAYRRQLQAEFNVNPAWDRDFIGSRAEVEGRPVDGFFKFWQSSTAPGREAVAGKLRGVLEMAQNDQAIYEITQNAADCGATDLRLWYNDAQFLAFNDGEAFTPRDVKSILDTFGSEKALLRPPEGEGLIGQYGVGFKLFHRLVGRESGLEELLDQGAGPMIFSWSNPAQLEAFLQEGSAAWEPVGAEQDAPWLFKILLTCFPAAPGEVVRDIHYQEWVAFTAEEAEAFRSWARSRLEADRPAQGSLFFLALGEGKREVLDKHMEEIRSCMGVSMHFLRKLSSITVNDERIERVPLDSIELRIPKAELHAIGLKDERQDVDLVFAYSVEAMDRLVKEPTLYQYFPMTKEAHGMAYVIHSNGLQKQAQRTELNADSTINARLLERLAARVIDQAREWMRSDPEKYRALFKVILSSAFEPCKLKVLHEQVQQPLIQYIRDHVPTMDGGFVPKERVRIRRSKLAIPASVLGQEFHWFHWTKDLDESVLAHARNSSRLNLQEATVGTLLDDKGSIQGLYPWLADLPDEHYAECLIEFAVLKLDPAKHPDLPFLRMGDRTGSLSAMLAEPVLLAQADAWYAGYPDAGEWLPRQGLELALVAIAPAEWSDATAALLYQLRDEKAQTALMERIPEIVLDDHPTPQVQAFMEWWFKVRQRPVAGMIRTRLMLRTGEEFLGWEDTLVLERFTMRLPSDREVELSIQRLLPNLASVGVSRFDVLRDALLQSGYDGDFLEEVFRRKREKSKQDLQRIGDKLADQYAEQPLANGCQVVFAIALKHQHPQWQGLEHLALLAADGNSYSIDERWALSGPSFINRLFLLHEQYDDIREYLGDRWDPIKTGSKGLVVAEYRLGESFAPELVSAELDEAQRLSFLDWLLHEHQRNAAGLYQVRSDEYKPVLEAVLGGHPVNWIIGPNDMLVPNEQVPAWVLTWMDGRPDRLALLGGLGVRGEDDDVLRWRSALLNDQDPCDAALPLPPENTLNWVAEQGGAETFTSALQEKRITDLIRTTGSEPGTGMRLALELNARESSDPVYLDWKAEGHGWSVWEHEGADLPVDVTWNEKPLARRHGLKVHAPSDGLKRIFITSGYPIMVALYMLSEGAKAPVPTPVRDSFQRLHDKAHGGSKKDTQPKERPVEELELKQQVEYFRERQCAFSAQPSITLGEVANAVEWEYRQKLLDREMGKAIRFKEVEPLADGVLVLRRPNVAELPYELVSDRDRAISGMKLKLRKRGVAYQEIAEFELLAGTEGEVRVRVPKLPFEWNASTVATIELPVDDMLLRMLSGAWRQVAQGHEPSRPIIDLMKERAPGSQVGFIFGPPGTGKTTELAKRLIDTVRSTEAKVLVLTPTNTAADVLYQRISEKASEDLKVLQGVHRFNAENKDIPLEEGYPAVVITTMHRFTFDRFANGVALNTVDWDHVVFDEASMVSLPYALLPLMSLPATRSASDRGALGARFLFAGDPFQLMPVAATPSMGDRLEAEKKDLVLRGFATENVFTLAGIDRFGLEEAPQLPGARIDRLSTNYRSGSSIVRTFSQTFYDGGVSSARNSDDHAITLGSAPLPPIALWAFPAAVPEKGAPPDDLLDPATIIPFENSAVHVHSALLAARLGVVLAMENPGKSVIIICPYGRQVRVCQTLLEPFNKDRSPDEGPDAVKPVEVSSVHRYQGGEAEVVIFLVNPSASTKREDGRMVIGEIALFNDPHLINVAISRARDVLVLLAPEDNISRTGRSGYFLMDKVLTDNTDEGSQVEGRPSEELEQLLFNGQTLKERVSVLPIRAMDIYRVQETRARGTDLVVLHNKENLNLVMTEDLVMEGIQRKEHSSITENP
jgi:hypothetical protein